MISASGLFQAVNSLALLSWILLIVFPNAEITHRTVRNLAVPIGLSLVYFAVVLFKFGQAEGGFGSLAEVMQLFQAPWSVTAGWTHYLAFDLFVGIWIVADAEKFKISRWFVAPCLFMTFMLGPIGLLSYLAARALVPDSVGLARFTQNVVSRFKQRNQLLTSAGLVFLALAAVTFGLQFIDPRTVDDSSVWLKPAKFFASLGVYYFTIAWILGDLPNSSLNYSRNFAKWTILVGVVEMLIIGGQAARGVRSHYNLTTVMDDVLYKTMGVFIVLNLFAVCHLWRHWSRQAKLADSPLYRIAANYGLLIFTITGLLACYMSAIPWSRVGAYDSQSLVPILGWNQAGGDLRISHFLGLHALQIFLVAGSLFQHRPVQKWMIHVGGLTYLILTIGSFALAAIGVPIFSG